MRLVEPNIAYQHSYVSFVNEFLQRKEALIPFVLKEDYQDFAAMVDRLKGYSKGIGVASEFVPHTTCWFVNQSDDLLGVANLRFQLTPRLRQIGGNIGFSIRPSQRGNGYAKLMLKHGLLKLKEGGLNHVLITCDKSNFASRAVIVANQGVFHSEKYFADFNDYVQRFTIDI